LSKADHIQNWLDPRLLKKVAEVKAVLKDHQLATPDDMRGLKKAQLTELLYRRALSQAEETGKA